MTGADESMAALVGAAPSREETRKVWKGTRSPICGFMDIGCVFLGAGGEEGRVGVCVQLIYCQPHADGYLVSKQRHIVVS